MSLQQAHDLYLALLNLGLHDNLEPFLREALELWSGRDAGEQGYLELADDERRGRRRAGGSHTDSRAKPSPTCGATSPAG